MYFTNAIQHAYNYTSLYTQTIILFKYRADTYTHQTVNCAYVRYDYKVIRGSSSIRLCTILSKFT